MALNKWLLLIVFFFITIVSTSAQVLKLVTDKPGAWKIVDFGVYTHYSCGFSKAATQAHYQKLLAIAQQARKNPVLNDIRGFDMMPTFYAQNCTGRYMYGIPASVHFEFHTWSLNVKSGKEVRWDIEPPYWDIQVNNLWRYGSGANSIAQIPKEEQKPGFDKQKFEAASNRLNDLFQEPGKKEVLQPGLDRYGETVILYNPERPDYWLPVSLKEVYDILKAYWLAYPDAVTSKITLDVLEQSYSGFTEAEKNAPAHAVGMLLGQYGADSKQPAILRINPAYWNKNLPQSAIQFMWFTCPADRRELTHSMQENLKLNSGIYHENRFENSLEVDLFLPLIDR